MRLKPEQSERGTARSGNNCRNYGCKENFRTDSDVPHSSNHKMPCEFRDETRVECATDCYCTVKVTGKYDRAWRWKPHRCQCGTFFTVL